MSQSGKGGRNLSHNISISQQERLLIKPQEVMQLSLGEFIGQTVESTLSYFRVQTRLPRGPSRYSNMPFFLDGPRASTDDQVAQNLAHPH